MSNGGYGAGQSPPKGVEPAEDDDTEAWIIEPDEVRITRILNEDAGSTAIVYLADWRGKDVAVKEMRDKQDDIVIHRELSVLTSVKHRNIVQLFGIVADHSPIQLCLEYCQGGSLFELLHETYFVRLSWRQRLLMLYDTAVAMDHLHSFTPKIVHRDLKSLNILLLKPVKNELDHPHVKVCDFGVAREHVAGCVMTQGAGTVQWMAPEVIKGTDYTEAADIFSYAIVAFEVICRRVPSIKGIRNDQFSWAVRKGKRPDIMDPLYIPEVVPAGLIELTTQCWDQDPSGRPTFKDIWQTLAKICTETPDDIKLFIPIPPGMRSL